MTHGQCPWHGDQHGLFHPETPNPRVIVTGGAGFIGSALVKRLRLTHGPGQVKVIDNLSRGKLENLSYRPGNVSINLVEDFCNIDLRNETATLQTVRGAMTVYHLADIVGVAPFLIEDNTLIITHVLRACRQNMIRQFINAGSTYSSTQPRSPISELSYNATQSAEMKKAHAWSKLLNEYHAQLAQLEGVLDVGLLRFHNVYGPHSDWSTQAIPKLIRKAIQFPLEPYVLLGSRSQYRELLFVADVAEALMLVQKKGLNKGVIQIGTEDMTTGRQLATIIRELVQLNMNKTTVQLPRHQTSPSRVPDMYDGKRAWQLLEWTARHSLAQGISITVNWMFHAMNKTAFASPAYSDRVLVILIGTPRGGPLAWKSLKKHVLVPLHADLMLYFGKSDPNIEHNNISFAYWKDLHDMAQHVFFEDEHSDWGDVLDQASLGHDSRPTDWLSLCKFRPQWLGGVGRGCNHMAGSAIQLAFKYLVQKKLVSTGLIDQYDRFVYSRADFLYACDYPAIATLDASSVWIPDGEDYGGLEDRHMISSRRGILTALNMTHDLMSEPTKWFERLNQSVLGQGDWNPEKILLVYYNYTQGIRVRRFNHPAFIVKTAVDKARWMHGDGSLLPSPLNTTLRVKYPGELYISQQCLSWKFNMENLIQSSPLEWFTFPLAVRPADSKKMFVGSVLAKFLNV
eukprot:CAMPEP_0119104672 /NCGR_PEP_ID=MMETSP1180-20130426/2824_1 /TAXON_ID=3052 ORGANISM="Chlamydomonas cf sp, Strain CCMP681" /NCGR_SAMPLE_ID=MMETSP1180 /ASSEMBLY_ACC=CAM_ASM_000741 /LENGTH=682 /DNA_ID=CAMNT_0007089493 /DNA_START=220 /DNA_END=2268 /DNA_ORIENTATION=+